MLLKRLKSSDQELYYSAQYKRIVLFFTLFILTQYLFTQQIISLKHWKFKKHELGGIWEVWRNQEHVKHLWETVEVPHCFNAFDAVDPDVEYYQGKGWYKTFLTINNPYKNGRTILHF